MNHCTEAKGRDVPRVDLSQVGEVARSREHLDPADYKIAMVRTEGRKLSSCTGVLEWEYRGSGVGAELRSMPLGCARAKVLFGTLGACEKGELGI